MMMNFKINNNKKIDSGNFAAWTTICQHAAHTTDQFLLAAKQEAYKRAYLLTKNIEEFSGKSLEERSSRQKTIRQKG